MRTLLILCLVSVLLAQTPLDKLVWEQGSGKAYANYNRNYERLADTSCQHTPSPSGIAALMSSFCGATVFQSYTNGQTGQTFMTRATLQSYFINTFENTLCNGSTVITYNTIINTGLAANNTPSALLTGDTFFMQRTNPFPQPPPDQLWTIQWGYREVQFLFRNNAWCIQRFGDGFMTVGPVNFQTNAGPPPDVKPAPTPY